jgi:hypothetical protein
MPNVSLQDGPGLSTNILPLKELGRSIHTSPEGVKRVPRTSPLKALTFGQADGATWAWLRMNGLRLGSLVDVYKWGVPHAHISACRLKMCRP